MQEISEKEVTEMVKEKIRSFNSNTKAGAFFGCSPSMASRVASGNRAPTKEMLSKFGITSKAVVVHTRKYYLDDQSISKDDSA